MRHRRLILLVSFIASAIVPALALAGTFPENQYEGRLAADPHTYFGFDVVHQNGDRKVKRIFSDAPYFCYGGSHGYLFSKVPGSFTVHDNGTFGGRHQGSIEGVPTTFTVRGELLRHGRARGRFKWRASNSVTCYTGLLDWRAKRAAEVVPEPPPGGP